MLGTSSPPVLWIASRIARARALKEASALIDKKRERKNEGQRFRARSKERNSRHDDARRERDDGFEGRTPREIVKSRLGIGETTHMWWLLTPRMESTWRVTPAAVANDSNTCEIISVDTERRGWNDNEEEGSVSMSSSSIRSSGVRKVKRNGEGGWR